MIASGNNFQYQFCYFLYINLGFLIIMHSFHRKQMLNITFQSIFHSYKCKSIDLFPDELVKFAGNRLINLKQHVTNQPQG